MRAPALRIHHDELIVDGFAGGGGASTGIEWGLGRAPDLAINHDADAIAMHRANHPRTRHLISNVWEVDPVAACAGRRVALFWLSPDCTYHSIARGGKPFRHPNRAKRLRGLAWVAVKWARAVKPRVITLENVREFEDWGPLLADGTPCPERAGMTFKRFVRQLENLGYRVEWRDLVACDYGAPTSRARLFLVARCDGRPIVWPQPTHGPGRAFPWRTAAECIDWRLPCPSIFLTPEEARAIGVKRPLALNTERRVARGVFKHVIGAAEPFIAPITHSGDGRVHSVNEPLRTITTAKRGEFALFAPHLVRTAHGDIGRNGSRRWGRGTHPLEEPIPTLPASRDLALCAHTLITTGYGERAGQAPRVPGLDKPLGTLVGTNKHALVAAFLAKNYEGFRQGAGIEARSPLHTITARDHHALVASNLLKLKGTSYGQAIDEPMPTVQAQGLHIGEVRAFLIRYYSEGGQWGALDKPLATLTTRDRIGLVTVHGFEYLIADIGMRMLVRRELFRGQGFPEDYIIDPLVQCKRTQRPKLVPMSNEKSIEMCGNSVPPHFAMAVTRAQFVDRYEEIAA